MDGQCMNKYGETRLRRSVYSNEELVMNNTFLLSTGLRTIMVCVLSNL